MFRIGSYCDPGKVRRNCGATPREYASQFILVHPQQGQCSGHNRPSSIDWILINMEGKALMSVALTYLCLFIASILKRFFARTLRNEETKREQVENLIRRKCNIFE